MPRRKADAQEIVAKKQDPGTGAKEGKQPGIKAIERQQDIEEKVGKQQSIEEDFAQLEEIIRKLEAGDSTLEEAFSCYEAGMKLVRSLGSQIDKVEKKIQILSEGDENE